MRAILFRAANNQDARVSAPLLTVLTDASNQRDTSTNVGGKSFERVPPGSWHK